MLGFLWLLLLAVSVIGAAISPYLMHLEAVRTNSQREWAEMVHGSSAGIRDTTLGLSILIGSLVAIPVLAYLYRRHYRRLAALVVPGLETGLILRIDPPLHGDPKLRRSYWIVCGINALLAMIVLSVGFICLFEARRAGYVALATTFLLGTHGSWSPTGPWSWSDTSSASAPSGSTCAAVLRPHGKAIC